MDIIITGATGFIGGAVVRRAIETDLVRHAFVLTRSSLPVNVSRHSKITVIQHNDFSIYPLALLERLAGCEACIWCLGRHGNQFPDKRTARIVSVDYPIVAATAFMIHLAPWLRYGDRFRFIFASRKFAEWDDDKTLFFDGDNRRMKGAAEKRLLALAALSRGRLNVSILRGCGIMATRGGWLKSKFAKMINYIAVDDFAYELILLSAGINSPEIVEARELLQCVNY
ncbi:hypothetical protein EV127DRAFT_478975 [Xylaria flabelliformis]|nr:hypothetical protein EV127DRAFT_478975 [Xylaria flabelliformis]